MAITASATALGDVGGGGGGVYSGIMRIMRGRSRMYDHTWYTLAFGWGEGVIEAWCPHYDTCAPVQREEAFILTKGSSRSYPHLCSLFRAHSMLVYT